MNASIKSFTKSAASELLYWASIAYLLYVVATLLSFVVHDYADFVTFFTGRYPKAYRIEDYGSKFFTLDHYRFVRSWAPFAAMLIVAGVTGMLWKRAVVVKWIDELFTDLLWLVNVVKKSFGGMTSGQRLMFYLCVGVLISLKLYLFIVLPFHVDEVFNFVYFSDQGVFHSSVFSNSRVLSNIISSVGWQVGFSPEISVRLTSIIAAVLVHVLVFSVLVHYFDFRAGLFTMMATGLTLWSNIYSVEGGGYMLMSLFALIGVVGTTSMIQTTDRGYWLFAVACIFGLYSSRLFVIPMMSFAFLAIRARDKKRMLTMFIVAVTVTVMLYLPMYLWSGGEVFFYRDVDKHDLVRMSPMFFESLSVITEINRKSYLVIMVLIITGVIFFRRSDARIQFLIALGVVTIASIVLFSFVTKTYPPSRAFIYANIFFYGIVTIIITRLTALKAILVILIIFKVASGVYLWNSGWQHQQMGLQDRRSYVKLTSITNQILSDNPAILYTDDRYTFLEFYLRLAATRKGQPLNIIYRQRTPETELIETDFGTVFR